MIVSTLFNRFEVRISRVFHLDSVSWVVLKCNATTELYFTKTGLYLVKIKIYIVIYVFYRFCVFTHLNVVYSRKRRIMTKKNTRPPAACSDLDFDQHVEGS